MSAESIVSLAALDRSRIGRQAAAVLLGLNTLTIGNALVFLHHDDNPKTSGEDISIEELTNAEFASTPDTIASPSKITTQIVSRPRPLPYKELETAVKPPSAAATPAATPTARPAPSPTASVAPKRLGNIPRAQLQRRESEVRPMTETSKLRIDGMQLSLEGYQAFLQSIDKSHLSYAQQFIPFDPNRVDIPQHKSEFFTLHFTAFYSNGTGQPKTHPIGEIAIRDLIKGMGGRSDVCCGINWILGRDGTVYQTAPVNAKLRHNPPYDSITTGVEVESVDQDSITTKQYESLSYLSLAVIRQQELHQKMLPDALHGHGEDRDSYRSKNPNSKWEVRNDFDKPVTDYFRQKLREFIQANPAVYETAVNLQ